MTTFTILDIFGHPYARQGSFVRYERHGWILPSGAWCAYAPADGTAKSATFAIIRWKGKRKLSAVPVERFVSGLPFNDYEIREGVGR